jgi:hypothetical protein
VHMMPALVRGVIPGNRSAGHDEREQRARNFIAMVKAFSESNPAALQYDAAADQDSADGCKSDAGEDKADTAGRK